MRTPDAAACAADDNADGLPAVLQNVSARVHRKCEYEPEPEPLRQSLRQMILTVRTVDRLALFVLQPR